MADPVDELCERLREVSAIERAAGVLRWDQEVVMPPGGTPARAEERSTLVSAAHARWTGDAMRRAIDDADAAAQAPDERAIVREARRVHERRVRTPDALVRELAEAASKAHPRWVEAKREDDFAAFQPALEEIVDLRRRIAEAIAPDRDPYAVLYEGFEPWIPWEDARGILEALVDGLQPLVDAGPPGPKEDAFPGTWPADEQLALVADVLEELGLDPDRARLDESEHPFTSGNPFDVRVTTRLDEDDPLSGLTSAVHELGHALYTQNLPREHLGTPLGQDRDLVVHEANARLWENHVARSRGFWDRLAPTMAERFGKALDPAACWRAANRVEPGLIRVDADEVTYHLHIAVRVAVETRLVRGELAVEDAPALWNDRMEELLGLRPPTDREGILQDVHWSHGSIGYFPTYSLGSALAAQLADAVQADVGPIGEAARAGEMAPLRDALRERVHRHGQRYETPALIEEATGGPLSGDALVGYLEDKLAR